LDFPELQRLEKDDKEEGEKRKRDEIPREISVQIR
jgi:hypothetical protein